MSDYIVVERKVRIAATAEHIQTLIVDFHKWLEWSPWEGLDPNLNRTYSGPDAGVGAHYEWSGNRKAGAGEMTVESVSATAVDIELTFTKPFKSKSRAMFDLQTSGPDTTVTWQILTPKSFMLKIMSIFMSLEKTVGPDLEKGLATLKVAAEANA